MFNLLSNFSGSSHCWGLSICGIIEKNGNNPNIPKTSFKTHDTIYIVFAIVVITPPRYKTPIIIMLTEIINLDTF